MENSTVDIHTMLPKDFILKWRLVAEEVKTKFKKYLINRRTNKLWKNLDRVERSQKAPSGGLITYYEDQYEKEYERTWITGENLVWPPFQEETSLAFLFNNETLDF